MRVGSIVIAFAPVIGPVYGEIVLKYYNLYFLLVLITSVILIIWLLGEYSIIQKSELSFTPLPFEYFGGIALTGLLTSTLLIVSFSGANNYKFF